MATAPLREIINAVAYATRPRFILENDEHERTRRPSPSAGALHPIDTIILDCSVRPWIMRYEPIGHTLQVLSINDRDKAGLLIEKIHTVLPFAKGTALVFLADYERASAFYENPDSLLWRDAGALLQTLLLSAAAFRLACCPVGLLGNEIIDAIGLKGRFLSVGVTLIGHTVPNNPDTTRC